MKKFCDFLATGIATTSFTGFLGKDGKGGGTIGSVVAFVNLLTFVSWGVSWYWVLAISILSLFLGLVVVGPAAGWILARRGPRRKHDGSETSFDFNQINWDEYHGMFVAALPIFLVGTAFNISEAQMSVELFWAFVFFRFFDIKKPWLIKKAEKLSGALGVMLDDTVAGAFAAVLVAIDIAIRNLHWPFGG